MLLLRLHDPAEIRVGRLGELRFEAGLYAYVGSAQGPGGLRARIARHLRTEKRLHWHIDRLTAHARPVEVWLAESTAPLECGWAQAIAALPNVTEPAHGFGASDCTCRTHLFHLPDDAPDVAWELWGKSHQT